MAYPLPATAVPVADLKTGMMNSVWYRYFVDQNINDPAHINFNVKDYGAVGDGVTDDTGAIQAAIDAMKASVLSNPNGFGFNIVPSIVYAPPGKYLITSSLDLTNIEGTGQDYNWGVIGDGAVFIVQIASGNHVAFDCVNSSAGWFRGFTILGDANFPPYYGIQLGGIEVAFQTKVMLYFDHINVIGYFKRACVLNQASELNLYESCEFSNGYPAKNVGSTHYCVILDGWHHLPIFSDYDTLDFAPDTADSCGTNTFQNCSFLLNNSGADDAAIYVTGCDSNSFKNCYVQIQGDGVGDEAPAVILEYNIAAATTLKGFTFDLHTESSGADSTSNIEFRASSNSAVTLANSYIRDNYSFATVAILRTGSNVTSVDVRGCNVEWGNVSTGALTAGTFTFNACLINGINYLPSYTVVGVPSATLPGQLIYVSNETGGATVAFSDGTNWRRVQDRNIVS